MYRSRFLQVNTRVKALDEIYKIYKNNIISKNFKKRKNVIEGKGQIVFKYNNGAVASSIMRREPVRS